MVSHGCSEAAVTLFVEIHLHARNYMFPVYKDMVGVELQCRKG